MKYDAISSLPGHFYQHAVLALAPEVANRGTIAKNRTEKLGDAGLWTIENFPGKVWSWIKDPRFVTVALTQLALFTNNYLFYPVYTTVLAKKAIAHIPSIAKDHIRFGAYLLVVAHILSAAFRAYGRVSNKDLMDSWYKGNIG